MRLDTRHAFQLIPEAPGKTFVLEENIEVRLPGYSREYGLDIPRDSQILLSKSIYGLVQAGNAWNDSGGRFGG